MKKITLLLLTMLAFTLQGFAQITVSDSPALAIPDNDPVGTSTTIIVGTATGTITDLDVDLEITHTWNGDLIVELTSPQGTTVRLIDRPGVPDPPSGAGCADDGYDINLNDEGTDGSVEDFCDTGNPGPGDVAIGDFTVDGSTNQPTITNNLADFDGEDPTGTWTLFVSDNAGGDTGQVDVWGMQIQGATLGLDENTLEGFSFSPNPVKNELNLTSARNITNVEVFNLIGQQVMRVAPNTVSSRIDMSALNAGAYFVRVSVGDVAQTVKIIKE